MKNKLSYDREDSTLPNIEFSLSEDLRGPRKRKRGLLNRRSRDNSHVINLVRVDMSLQQLLQAHRYRWDDPKFDSFRNEDPTVLRRPSNQSKALMRAAVELAAKRRRLGQTTGFLYDPTKIGVRTVPAVSKAHWDTTFRLFPIDDDEQGENKSEAEALKYVLRQIFRLGVGDEFPAFVRSWVDLIDHTRFHKRRDVKRLLNHPILWASTSRSYFFEKAWMKIQRDCPEKTKIIKALRNVADINTWKTNIVPGTPFGEIYRYERRTYNKRGNDPLLLLKFVRACFFHIRDKTVKGTYRYILNGELQYLKEGFVEMEISRIYPTLLEDLVWELQKLGCYL